MSRPRKADSRNQQINIRFTAPELVRVHAHAAITGKSVTDFGRAVLLRRPRRRRRADEPAVIALSETQLQLWQRLGTRLNAIAHVMNARDDLPPTELLPALAQLRALLEKSFSAPPDRDAVPGPYTLAPSARHHLRKVGVNLAQINLRLDRLGLETPIILVRQLARIRTLMNGDQPPHGA